MTTGLKNVLANLSKEIKKIQGGTLKGVKKAAIIVQEDAQDRTPVDFGALRGSAFNQAEMQGNRAVARVGYTQKYAPWVHEMPMTLKGQPRADFGITSNRSKFGPQKPRKFGGGSGRGVYWEGGENKFLEKAIKNNQPLILKVIADEAKIGDR